MKRIYVYKRFERFWHWMQALLVVVLAVTGFGIHFNWGFMNFQFAVELHRVFAWAFVILIAFAIFWHLTTGEWKQYIPGRGRGSAIEMVLYYTVGIFHRQPHPGHKTALSKLNPLQKVTYLGLKLLVIPLLVTSGFLYYYYNDWAAVPVLRNLTLTPVAFVHTAAGYVLMAFLFLHVYLTTTGTTATSNVRAMVTGWEDLEDEADAPEAMEAAETD